MDEMQQRCFQFFWEQSGEKSGLVADRARSSGESKFSIASTASTGFGLAGICIAEERGWITHEQAYNRVLKTLRFLNQNMPHHEGWFYHFTDIETGERVWKCELSTIDTALLLGGVLTVRQYYKGTEVESLATQIYDRVNFPWFLNDHGIIKMSWKPEQGFSQSTWGHYSEHLMLQLLGLGSNTKPLPPNTWHSWKREPVIEYQGKSFLSHPPLFIHQFSHAFVDFRNKRDDYADYWMNSVLATEAHRQMFISDLSKKYPYLGENLWGLTASDHAGGYTAWGGPPITANFDGTVVPCAPAGSIPFAPEACMQTLGYMYKKHANKTWRKYGFIDAFNLDKKWYAKDVIGIDKGITLLMIENHRSGLIWKLFMANPEIQRAMKIANFRDHPSDLKSNTSLVSQSDATAGSPNLKADMAIVSADKTWDKAQWIDLNTNEHLELGQPFKAYGVAARFALMWDRDYLHFKAIVQDGNVKNGMPASDMYMQDCVELYIDPQNDGLRWMNTDDFQFGFAPTNKIYEWFGQRYKIDATVTTTETGYQILAKIPWKDLKTTPTQFANLQIGVTIKSVNEKESADLKLNWRWKSIDDHIELGKVQLQ
ncbi:glucoamylase family protein [Poriferisphaera sp. WC338]|uniref:glucoamylase family protein n=1 Tax=Poriferisphaera sp. WC338 TaxID=3425129 RepID=UPI003D814D12